MESYKGQTPNQNFEGIFFVGVLREGGMSDDDGYGLVAFRRATSNLFFARIATSVLVHQGRRQYLRVNSNTHAAPRGSNW
jgi:hypothetical protein